MKIYTDQITTESYKDFTFYYYEDSDEEGNTLDEYWEIYKHDELPEDLDGYIGTEPSLNFARETVDKLLDKQEASECIARS